MVSWKIFSDSTEKAEFNNKFVWFLVKMYFLAFSLRKTGVPIEALINEHNIITYVKS